MRRKGIIRTRQHAGLAADASGPIRHSKNSGRARAARPEIAYQTANGQMLMGTAEELLGSSLANRYRGKVNLIFTSPPFPLNRKKKYGNHQGGAYEAWLASFGMLFRKMLKRNGSLVIEMGNAWEPGRPTMSTLALRSLLKLLDAGRFKLCQQFVCYNPARLPSPAQWVNIERIRVKDSFTHVWWMSPTARPRADNRRVLVDYSRSMHELLASSDYNAGKRPSGHKIGAKSFLTNNGGAIPSNVLTLSNTGSSDYYHQYCRQHGYAIHPARMPAGLPKFFIDLLTRPGDLVFDPFAGSNTTGAIAEDAGRRWVSVEPNSEYIRGSLGRFASAKRLKENRPVLAIGRTGQRKSKPVK